MRERLSIQKPINWTETQADKIQAEADRLGVSFSEIVRECTMIELPRLRAREHKRRKKREKSENAVND